ncbi:ATP-binding protein [Actinomycetospora sp. CA-101289]|uniref:ATP-binding protein n=1 Tax=Actinomycetospora sp. CA-101289 TaxID=3239893 RepID=UPI003D950CD6
MITNRDLACIGLETGCVCPLREGPVRGAWLWERRPARTASRAPLRRLVHRWTRVAVADEEVGESIVLAVDEAVGNVVEHAYRGAVGEVGAVSVLALPRPCGHGVGVVVEDQGLWSAPAADPGLGGRGLALIDELADHHSLTTSAAGTTVRMCWRTLVRA